jgi:hypothetical protein
MLKGNPNLKGYTKRTIKLNEVLGKVSIYVPKEFDTLFEFYYHDIGAPVW